MKKDYEIYLDTGILGGYAPERITCLPVEDKILPVYRDANCRRTEHGMELHREMLVGGRVFRICSVFSAAEDAKTPTEKMLSVIDSDLAKDPL